MSSLGAAQRAASANVPVPVIAREILHEGSIVMMKVPVDADDGSYPKGDERIPFLHFYIGFRGEGVMHFYVHDPDPGFLGQRIKFRASVILKLLEDGREYLYVDLAPVPSDTPITHRLVVMGSDEGSWDYDDHLVFKTPPPLTGQIVFAPPEAKIIRQADVVPLPRPRPTMHKGPHVLDRKLNRLKVDGWLVEDESGPDVVHLYKEVGGRRKTMVYHRPKPKPKPERKPKHGRKRR